MSDEHGTSEELSPFAGPTPAEWDALRGKIVPYIGERALSLLAFAVFDEAGGHEGAAYFRAALAGSGTDVDAPEVTEAEELLIRWGRQRVSSGVEPELGEQFAQTFNLRLRELLGEFVGLTLATIHAGH